MQVLEEVEIKYLDLAKQIIALNPDTNMGVTGSLMLALRGIYLGREAKDIDIICSHIKKGDGTKFDDLNLPEGAVKNRPSYPDSASYTIPLPDGSVKVKVDFLVSIEKLDEIDGCPVGEVEKLLIAKANYMTRDNSEGSRSKHKMDIEIMIQECDPTGSLGYGKIVDDIVKKKKNEDTLDYIFQ